MNLLHVCSSKWNPVCTVFHLTSSAQQNVSNSLNLSLEVLSAVCLHLRAALSPASCTSWLRKPVRMLTKSYLFKWIFMEPLDCTGHCVRGWTPTLIANWDFSFSALREVGGLHWHVNSDFERNLSPALKNSPNCRRAGSHRVAAGPPTSVCWTHDKIQVQ